MFATFEYVDVYKCLGVFFKLVIITRGKIKAHSTVTWIINNEAWARNNQHLRREEWLSGY